MRNTSHGGTLRTQTKLYVFRRVWSKQSYEYRRMQKHQPTQSLFGRRLKEARLRADIAQDRLGVMIGLDEESSSARMSRYESGVHEPPFKTLEQIAAALKVPAAYFFCEDDKLAEIIRIYFAASEEKRQAIFNAAIASRN